MPTLSCVQSLSTRRGTRYTDIGLLQRGKDSLFEYLEVDEWRAFRVPSA